MNDLWKLVLQMAIIAAYCIAIAKLFGNQMDRIEGLCIMCVADHISLRDLFGGHYEVPRL